MKLLPWILSLVFLGPALAQSPDLRKFMGREDVWPREVTIKQGLAAAKGQAAVPAGAKGKVVGVEGSLIGVEIGGVLTMVPAEQTDFAEKAAAALAENPNPPGRRGPAGPATPPPPAAKPTEAPKGGHALAELTNHLMYADGTKIPNGQVKVSERNFILLAFGGGLRWGADVKDLVSAVKGARRRQANFEVIQIPIPGMTVELAGQLLRENEGIWPSLDPRANKLVEALWKTYGHNGTFALALVDKQGQLVVRTTPVDGRKVDLLESVIQALGKIP